MSNPSVGTTEWNERASAHMYKFLERDPIDNYTTKHPALAWLRARQSTFDGGKPAWPIFYGRTAIGRSYTRGQAFTPSSTEAVTTAETDLMHFVEPITVYRTDQIRAGGQGKLFDYMEQQTRAARGGMTVKHSALLWAASKASSTDCDSIPLAIPVDPTASVAFNNINGATTGQTFWRNKTATCTGSWSTDGINKLDSVCDQLADEGAQPELLVTTRAVFGFMRQNARGYMQLCKDASTKTGKMLADLGIPFIEHNGIPVVHDQDCTSGNVFALHSEAIEWVAHPEGDYKMVGDGFESLQITQVMGSQAVMALEGFLRVRNRRWLGRVDSITAA